MSDFEHAKQLMVDAAQDLVHKGYLMATGGNLSQRIAGQAAFAITPSNYDYLQMTSPDVCILNFDLEVLEGERQPSVESAMHGAIYQARPDVNAIVHSLGVWSQIFAAVRQDIPCLTIDAYHFLMGEVKCAGFGRLHRLRSAWMATRTARLNTLRGLLRELGLAMPVGARQVVPHVREWISDPSQRSRWRCVRSSVRQPTRSASSRRASEWSNRRSRHSRQSPAVARLRTIPGVGLLSATALVGFVGDVGRFPSGRHFASYLGLTPRESSSGLRRHLGRISKRGDPYLHMLLIHGARSVLLHAKRASRGHDRSEDECTDRPTVFSYGVG